MIVLRYLWTQGRIWRRHWCYECFGLSTCACRGWKLWNRWPTSWAQNIRHQGMISTLHIMSLWFGHGEQHNSVQTFSVCEVFVAQISSHIHSICNIYQHVHDLAQDNWRGNQLQSFHFKLCPPGGLGTDGDGLEDTQEDNGANGHTSAHSMNISGKFACKVTVHEAPPKICHCIVEATREQNQDVGNNQILDNQIYGPQPIPSAIKEEIMEQRNSPALQI